MRKSPLAVSLVTCVMLSSCGTTIVGSLQSTTTSSVVTTTTIPTGTVTSLLNEMLENVTGLGDIVVGKDMSPARERLQNVEAIWVALEPQLVALKNDTNVDVERIVNLVRSAVKKKRPADADKAARFIPLVLDATK